MSDLFEYPIDAKMVQNFLSQLKKEKDNIYIYKLDAIDLWNKYLVVNNTRSSSYEPSDDIRTKEVIKQRLFNKLLYIDEIETDEWIFRGADLSLIRQLEKYGVLKFVEIKNTSNDTWKNIDEWIREMICKELSIYYPHYWTKWCEEAFEEFFNENCWDIIFHANEEKMQTLLSIAFNNDPPYLLKLINIKSILSLVWETNYSISEIEDIVQVWKVCAFDRESYIKYILCSTPEKIAKFLDFIYDVIEDTWLIEGIEKHETKVTTKEWRYYNPQKHKNNYGIFYYEWESIDNRIECIWDEIETPFWKYNFTTKNFVIDGKVKNLKTAVNQCVILEKIINSEWLSIEVSSQEKDSFKNLQKEIKKMWINEEFIKLFYTFQKDKKHYIGTLRKQ